MRNTADPNRRDVLAMATTAAATAAVLDAPGALAQAPSCPPPPVLDGQDPLAQYWQKQVCELASVDLAKAAPELASAAVKERHQIYCFLLMKLIVRFWNGNKHGPLGEYPRRVAQREARDPTNRYRGDMIENPDDFRVNWDRYLGHNIACLAVDGNGEIIDFDFNHNDFFRSSAEHAESRMVRRLFSLADIRDSWKTGAPLLGRSRAFSLQDVTLYTSLESCAQCSGVMSLARVKQVVFLQKDFGTYMIGNIMYNLAVAGNERLAPLPIPGADLGVPHFDRLNAAYRSFHDDILDAREKNDSSRSFFVRPDKTAVDYSPSITSFLCTDVARDVFGDGARMLDKLTVSHGDFKFPESSTALTNRQCLDEARQFYAYADLEGYRGSPHKL